MTLEAYFRKNLTRSDPHPQIDHAVRAELHADDRITFYIHPHGADGDTVDFQVAGNTTHPIGEHADPP